MQMEYPDISYLCRWNTQIYLTYVEGIPGYILPMQMEYLDISYL